MISSCLLEAREEDQEFGNGSDFGRFSVRELELTVELASFSGDHGALVYMSHTGQCLVNSDEFGSADHILDATAPQAPTRQPRKSHRHDFYAGYREAIALSNANDDVGVSMAQPPDIRCDQTI